MALQSIKHGFPFPVWPTAPATAPSLSTATMDASGDKLANIQIATAAKSIHKVHLRTVVVATGDTVDVRIETVNGTTGDPTGTLWATTTNGALVIDGADDNTWKSVTLTSDATVAIGDLFAIVVVNGAVPGNIQIATHNDTLTHLPYRDTYDGGAWTKGGTHHLMVVEYSDGSFEPVFGLTDVGAPINTNSTFNSSATTNRRGNIFQVPFPTRANGCWVWIDADGDYTVKLYDSDGSTVLATTATVDTDTRSATTTAISFLPFTTTANLTANTNYRLAIVPSTTTNLISYDFDVPVAGMLDMFPGGQNCHSSVYTSPGVWVETTTRRAYLGVFLDAFSDGGGGTASIFSTPIVRPA